MQKKLEDEYNEMDQYERVQKRELEDKTALNESFFFGNQLNKFPTKDGGKKFKEQLASEVKRKRAEVPSVEEFEDIMRNQVSKGQFKIALFLVDKKYLQMLSTMNSTYRLLQLMSMGYCAVFWTAFYSANPHLATAYYLATGTTFTLTLGARYMYRKIIKDYVIKIDFDAGKRCFLVTSPASSLMDFGAPKELLV